MAGEIGMQRIATLFLSLALVEGCAVSGAGGSSDVTGYRGDSARTGVMPGPAPSGRPDLLWRFQARGAIESSVVVVGSAAFLASEDGTVHAIDLRTGAERWAVDVGSPIGSASPLAVSGVLVIADLGGTVRALDPGSGAERWRARLDGPVSGSAAAVGRMVVVATTTGSAYGINAESGAIVWRTTLPHRATRSATATEDAAYLGVGGMLIALRIADGSIKWQSVIATAGEAGTPTVANGLVFEATGFDAIAHDQRGVSAVDAGTGKLVWRYASAEMSEVFTPAVRDDRAYIVGKDGHVVALDARTGLPVWTVDTGAPNEALPSLAGDVLYVAANGGRVIALSSKGEALWSVEIAGVPYAPVVTRGLVLVGTSLGVLYAFGRIAS
jgi:eukaryotic-like serine/threonine-protein kinase